MEALPERERMILKLRFEQDLTQAEIAEQVGVSQMHVSRLLRRSLDRLAAASVAAALDSTEEMGDPTTRPEIAALITRGEDRGGCVTLSEVAELAQALGAKTMPLYRGTNERGAVAGGEPRNRRFG